MKLALALLAATSIAHADPAELEHKLKHPAPGKGLEKAPLRPVPWCHGNEPKESDWAETAANQLDDYRSSRHAQSRLVSAARLTCNAPSGQLAQRAAQEIAQYWINETGETDAEAVASLAARVDKDDFAAEHDKLCEAMEVPDGPRPKQMLGELRAQLFGCKGGDPLWLAPGNVDQLAIEFLDRGPLSHDDLAHLAWVIGRTYHLLDTSDKAEKALASYVVDQFDLHGIDGAAKAGEAYKHNKYARVVLAESLAYARMMATRVDERVAAKTQDAAWKEVLVTAPQRGAQLWLAAAMKSKEALERSDAVAAKPKGAHDCKALRDDFMAIAKPFKHTDVNTWRTQISDHPIAGLLLKRYVQCLYADGDQSAAQAVERLAEAVRVLSGPRQAAYYAALDALPGLEDQIAIKPDYLPHLTDEHEGRHDRIEAARITAVIASIGKTGKGVKVSFVKARQQVMSQKCTETKRVDRVLPDGKVVYRTVCHDTGLVWVDTTPEPVVVRAAHAGGLAVGRLVKVHDDAFEDAMPIVVYGDKVGKKLVAVVGFVLE